MIGDKWIKISKESIEYLQNTKKGHLSELPEELKQLFLSNPVELGNIWKKQQGIEIDLEEYDMEKDGMPFEDIYNYDGNLDDIKIGNTLIDIDTDIEYVVNKVTLGNGVAFLDIEGLHESIMIGMVYDERFRTLKIKE